MLFKRKTFFLALGENANLAENLIHKNTCTKIPGRDLAVLEAENGPMKLTHLECFFHPSKKDCGLSVILVRDIQRKHC